MLRSDTTIDMARLVRALGLGSEIAVAKGVISKLISDLIQGWSIPIVMDTGGRWKRLAGIFAFELTHANVFATEAHLQAVENAFLYGLGSGLEALNWQRNELLTRKMEKRVRQVGLDMTGKIVTAPMTTVTIPISPVRRLQIADYQLYDLTEPDEWEGMSLSESFLQRIWWVRQWRTESTWTWVDSIECKFCCTDSRKLTTT